MQRECHPSEYKLNRERHWRAICYFTIAFVLAALGHVLLGLDRAQTIGYAVSCYVMLSVVNGRAMFKRLPEERKSMRRE